MSSYLQVGSRDLAVAWGRALAGLARPGSSEVGPLVVNVANFDGGFPPEDVTVRTELSLAMTNAATMSPTLCSSETTANLIFPESLWLRHRTQGRQVFFDQYRKLLPRLKKRDPRNLKGTYFSRMIQYGASGTDQLAHVLDAWDGGTHRRSAFQIVVFDPKVDHHRQPFLGFPCLDYVTFTPDTREGTLSVTALYAEQYLFDRGYGNYLGLCRLGRFVAEQMKLRFNQLTCIASCAKLGKTIRKREAQALVHKIESVIRTEET
ncbi:hypothetical protein [Sorangium sp. So ce1182]|uniref:hypothetical protein n=1 Tax=Sorangium sp. So ce1182 TaxID=3133334 RepID=UPI003F603ED3